MHACVLCILRLCKTLCMCVCMYICKYMSTDIHTSCMCMHFCMHLHAYLYMYIYTYLCMCLYVHTVRKYVCSCIYIYIYICNSNMYILCMFVCVVSVLVQTVLFHSTLLRYCMIAIFDSFAYDLQYSSPLKLQLDHT